MRSVRLHRASRVVHKVSAVREQRRSSVAHWAAGADGRGALLTGDTIAIGADLASVNLMRSSTASTVPSAASTLVARPS